MKILKNDKGFTIIETLISAAILSLAILGASLQYVSQIQAQAALNSQSANRVILNQIVSSVTAAPSNFPNVTGPANTTAVYIGCFDTKGAPIPNNISGSGSSNFVMVFTGLTYSDLTLPISLVRAPVCLSANGLPLYEVHVAWVGATGPPAYQGAVQINSIFVPGISTAYKVAAPSIQQYVVL